MIGIGILLVLSIVIVAGDDETRVYLKQKFNL